MKRAICIYVYVCIWNWYWKILSLLLFCKNVWYIIFRCTSDSVCPQCPMAYVLICIPHTLLSFLHFHKSISEWIQNDSVISTKYFKSESYKRCWIYGSSQSIDGLFDKSSEKKKRQWRESISSDFLSFFPANWPFNIFDWLF